MKRRTFLQFARAAALVKVAGPEASNSLGSAPRGSPVETLSPSPPEIINIYSPDDHRRRLQNLAICERAIRKCLRRHLITDYLPGQSN